MSRPTDWYPLVTTNLALGGRASLAAAPTLGSSHGWGSAPDPVPGDPDAVHAEGRRYQHVAEEISKTAAALRRLLTGGSTQSEAVDELRKSVEEVADQISHAHDRYDPTGGALITYAKALDTAKSASLAAYHRAVAAQRTIDAAPTAIRKARDAQDDARDADDDTALASAKRAEKAARGDLDDADVALRRAQADLDDVVEARNTAAQAAIDAIDAVRKADKLHDSWWTNVKHVLTPIMRELSKWAGTIAAIAGMAALFLSWVPILGEVLEAVALIATAVALVADIYLALFAGEGWTNVWIGLAGLATFGIGRVAGTALKIGARGAEAAESGEAGVKATTGLRGTIAETAEGGQAGKAGLPDRLRPALDGVGKATKVLSKEGWREIGSALNPVSIGREQAAALRQGARLVDPSELATSFKEGASSLRGAWRTGGPELVLGLGATSPVQRWGAVASNVTGKVENVVQVATHGAEVGTKVVQVTSRYPAAAVAAPEVAHQVAFVVDKVLAFDVGEIAYHEWFDAPEPTPAQELNVG